MIGSGKVLIVGASGMLGSDLVEYFKKGLPAENVVGASHADLDITRPDSIDRALERYSPSMVINASGYTNVDKAEVEREAANAINALGPRHLAQSCSRRDIYFVHFSTDQVFDGKLDRPYREEDQTNPLNYYAQTKLEGEVAALSYPNALVLRVQWLYGARRDRFTILKKLEVFTPFSDQIGAPTWTRHLCEAVGLLVAQRSRGLYHFSYDDYASWWEVFEFVKSQLNLSVRLVPKKTADVPLPAKRPLFSVLSNEKLKRTIAGIEIGSWRTDLAKFLNLSN
jgi:dTDP-4-dehydrorhamnose reductase